MKEIKDNVLTLKDMYGEKFEYRILLDISDTNSGVNYIIYTDDKKNENGDAICYASTYVFSDKGNMTKLKPVKDDNEFEFIGKILNSLESE